MTASPDRSALFANLNLNEEVAIRMAAQGAVSGRLRQWPVLASAFKTLGMGHDPMMWHSKMKEQAREALRAAGRVGPT